MIGTSLGKHMLRHAEWLLNRFQLSSSDNKTSFHRRWGIAFTSTVLPFGELVLAQDQSLAFWLGRCEATDQHILAKANSNSLVKSNVVTRLNLDSFMDLSLFKSPSLPPPELPSADYLKMAKLGDHTPATARDEDQLGLAFPLQAFTHQPQHKAIRKHKQQGTVSFQLPPGLAQSPSSQACPDELPDLAWQQPSLSKPDELQLAALRPPVVQQLASATTALITQVAATTPRNQPAQQQASQSQPVRSRMEKNSSEPKATKLDSLLEETRTFQEIELAVRNSEEELPEAQTALKEAQLHTYFAGDPSLFSAEQITRAKQKASERLHGTCEQVSRASFTARQLQQVIHTTWAFEEKASQGGDVSLHARIVDTSFRHQILEHDFSSCASPTSHISLKILLTLSLINKWGIRTANMSSACFDQALGPRKTKALQTAIGQLLWATPVRPAISFAVQELSRSFESTNSQKGNAAQTSA